MSIATVCGVGASVGWAATGAFEDEERQYEIYRGMLEGMAPGTVTVRTFDIDEDQLGPRVTQFPLAPGWELQEYVCQAILDGVY